MHGCLLFFPGSNSHNNQNPAGDGQAGDDGEGNRGRFAYFTLVRAFSLRLRLPASLAVRLLTLTPT